METIAMFTKHEGDAEKILFDLQANWYETEIGEWTVELRKGMGGEWMGAYSLELSTPLQCDECIT
jgi:hypothetical protein